MAAVTHGTSTEITFGGLDGLTDTSWAESAQVTTPDCHDLWIGGFVTGQATPTDGDTVKVYVAIPYDGANATTTIGGSIGSGLDGTSSTETEGTAFMQENLILADVITISAATTNHHASGFSLVSVVGLVPEYFSLVVQNDCGATLNATDGGDFYYTAVTYGSA